MTIRANPEQRKGEKQRLEKAYLDSDKRLNGLVQGLYYTIRSVTQVTCAR